MIRYRSLIGPMVLAAIALLGVMLLAAHVNQSDLHAELASCRQSLSVALEGRVE